jgi:hypothetical protein
MGGTSAQRSRREEALVRRIGELAHQVLFGSLAESYRTCGNPGCRCHHGGAKHGPYLAVTWRSDGKTAGYHVPAAAREEVRAGVAAWHEVQGCLRELAELNKERLLTRAKKKADP